MSTPINALPAHIASAFSAAAQRAGVSFDFFLNTAARESGLDSNARAKTSSAAGLFQFVEQTWLQMVARHGDRHGLGAEAKAVSTDKNGRLEVRDAAQRAHILNLRFKPEVAAGLAGELTRENSQILKEKLGREASEPELYVAHFLGAGKAAQLIRAAKETPNASAAPLFPRAAKANRAIFFNPSGAPRSVARVVQALKHLHQGDAPKAVFSQSPTSAPAFLPNGRSGAGIARSFLPPTGIFGAPALRLTPTLIRILSDLNIPASGASKPDKKVS